MSEQTNYTESSPSPRRRGDDRSSRRVSFLPSRNMAARRAYIFALLGLIPFLGLILGFPALLFGVIGRRAAKNEFKGNGLGHSFVSIILGFLEIVLNALGIYFLGRSFDWF